MRIDSLQVQNFKGFVAREWNFHPQMNLIVGDNAAGKSSLLDALCVASGSWLLGLGIGEVRPILAQEVRLQEFPAKSRKSTAISTSATWEFQFPCSIKAAGLVVGEPMSWSRAILKSGGRTNSADVKNIKALASQLASEIRIKNTGLAPVLAYYGTGRLWDVPRAQYQVKKLNSPRKLAERSRLRAYSGCLDPRVSIAALMTWIGEQAWIQFQNGGKETIAYRLVLGALKACLDKAKNFRFDPIRRELIIQFEDSTSRPFSYLSDGQRSFLALVADLAIRMVSLNPQLETKALMQTPGIVLIDELDLHLHPGWQRKAIESLRTTFPELQFFATTHSPFLIQSLRSGEELLMLEGQPTANLNNKTIETIAEGIMGVPEPQVGERYLEMKNVATDYLQRLEQAPQTPGAKQEEFKRMLAAKIAPFADNPAYQAFLEMHRTAKLKE